MIDREQSIREAAYYRWDAAGRPEGRELDFWAEAEREQTCESPAMIMDSRPAQAIHTQISPPALIAAPAIAGTIAPESISRVP